MRYVRQFTASFVILKKMAQKSEQLKKVSSRILALDYLRGFFIIVIIADHLWRWPNIFQFVSGRGELWSSAAEGFVIISGLLVGYIRGYKNRTQPLSDVSKKLAARGVMLYIWMIITTMLLVTASWLLNFEGSMAYIPIAEYQWGLLFESVLRFNYVHTLTHFLYLYAIFLVISPAMVWLLRRGLGWVGALVSVLVWMAGIAYSYEWMQWQILFFLPAVAGFYLDTILERYRQLSLTVRRWIRFGTIGIMASTVLAAGTQVLSHAPGTYENSLFGRDPMTIGTVIISFIWFVGLLSLFQLIMPWLKRWFGWLLLTFGERSLTAYILHTIPMVLCSLIFAEIDNFIVNSLLACACILFTWGLLKIPGINKVIPR